LSAFGVFCIVKKFYATKKKISNKIHLFSSNFSVTNISKVIKFKCKALISLNFWTVEFTNFSL